LAAFANIAYMENISNMANIATIIFRLNLLSSDNQSKEPLLKGKSSVPLTSSSFVKKYIVSV